MERGSFEARAHNAYPSLTAAERRVMDYLHGQPEQVLSLTLSRLAQTAGVSEPTVLRLCRRLGYEGYSEMKLTVARESGRRAEGGDNVTGDYEIASDDDLDAISRKVFAHVSKAVGDTAGVFDVWQATQAVEAILAARRVLFVGISTSACTAGDAFSRFLKLGLDCMVLTEAHQQLMVVANLQPCDVVVAFSRSGMTKDTVDVARLARERGATVICVTNYAHSHITRHADIPLITASYEQGFHSETMIARILQHIVVDILYLGVLLSNPARFTETIQNTNEALVDRCLQ